MLATGREIEMNPTIDEISLLRQAQLPQHHHHLVLRGIGGEIDLETGPGDDDPSFASTPLVNLSVQDPAIADDQEDQKQFILDTHSANEDHHDLVKLPQAKKKKNVVKKWREEWAETYKWAYVDVYDGSTRIFCTVCKQFGRKHRRNPYGNEGSRNMQMSALEEHNNSLLHKEAIRLQTAASMENNLHGIESPVSLRASLSKDCWMAC